MPARRLLLFLVALPAFCQAQIAPPWTRALPKVPGRIYAMGTASVAPSEAKALEQAAQNARFEVIARLRVGVSGTTTVSESLSQQQSSGSPARGTRQQYVRQDGTTTVQAVDLPGLVVEERYLDQKAGAAYALAYLDTAVADRALADRVGALDSDWKALLADPAAPGLRPAITRIQRVRGLQARATELETQASLLIPAGVPATHRADVQALGQAMAREVTGIQKGLTMGASVQGGDLAEDVLAMMRNTALRQGFVWTQKDPAMTLRINLRGAKQGLDIHSRTWWEVDASRADLVGTRARIRVSLVDANGDDQDSFELSVKGVGVDAFSSEQAFLKELKKVLPTKFQEFLHELVK
jgi:hypothetical protein